MRPLDNRILRLYAKDGGSCVARVGHAPDKGFYFELLAPHYDYARDGEVVKQANGYDSLCDAMNQAWVWLGRRK